MVYVLRDLILGHRVMTYWLIKENRYTQRNIRNKATLLSYSYRFESCPDYKNIHMSNYWMNGRRYEDGSKALTYFRKRKYMTSRNKYGKIRLTMWIAHHTKVEAAWYYKQGVEWTTAWKAAQYRNQ